MNSASVVRTVLVVTAGRRGFTELYLDEHAEQIKQVSHQPRVRQSSSGEETKTNHKLGAGGAPYLARRRQCSGEFLLAHRQPVVTD